jgi:glycosyltransferase involved in cell wall biosynthesis
MASRENALQCGVLARLESRALMIQDSFSSSLRLKAGAMPPSWIAVIGNHLPRQCGIATFTADLCNAISAEYEKARLMVVAVNDQGAHYEYPPRVQIEVEEEDAGSYDEAAAFLNSSSVGIVSLQHEYGIYGGTSGSLILRLLRRLTMPVVTTLHTVLREPNANQRIVMEEITALSTRLVVMSKHSSKVLQEVFRVPEDKIDLIPHGVPKLPFAHPNRYKRSTGTEGKTVLLTLGLLSPNKGIERVIEALPQIVAAHPEVVYLIVGAIHPHVRQREGDQYRTQLQALASKLGVERNVIFHSRFVSPEEMASFVGAADIYITPYPHEAQAVSGTLAYALGAGKAIISTPYWHAAELLAGKRGVLVPFEDSRAIAAAAIELLNNPAACQAMRKRAYVYARETVWNKVAESYMSAFVRARSAHAAEAVYQSVELNSPRVNRPAPATGPFATPAHAPSMTSLLRWRDE